MITAAILTMMVGLLFVLALYHSVEARCICSYP